MPAAKRAMRCGGVGGVGRDDGRRLARDAVQAGREPLGVLLVDRHHEAAGVRMVAAAQRGELGVGVAEHVLDPVALGLERGAQPARGLGGGQGDREVGLAAAAVAHPLHVAAVGVEGHRAADAVEQGVGVAVGVVGARDAVVVVVDPRDRRAVGAERRAGEEQAEAGALERLAGRAAPRRELAHVVRLVGDQQRGLVAAGAPVGLRAGRDRGVGDRDAVAVARLRPGGVRAVGLEVDPVARGVERPLAADVGRRRDDGDPGDPALGQHPVRDVQAERRLAGRGGGRGQERVALVGGDGRGGRLLPGAQRAAGRPRGQRPATPDGG